MRKPIAINTEMPLPTVLEASRYVRRVPHVFDMEDSPKPVNQMIKETDRLRKELPPGPLSKATVEALNDWLQEIRKTRNFGVTPNTHRVIRMLNAGIVPEHLSGFPQSDIDRMTADISKWPIKYQTWFVVNLRSKLQFRHGDTRAETNSCLKAITDLGALSIANAVTGEAAKEILAQALDSLNVLSKIEKKHKTATDIIAFEGCNVYGLKNDEELAAVKTALKTIRQHLRKYKCEDLLYGDVCVLGDETKGSFGTALYSIIGDDISLMRSDLKSVFKNNELITCLIHELGHRLWETLRKEEKASYKKAVAIPFSPKICRSPSEYGQTNWKESFAEHFSYYVGPHDSRFANRWQPLTAKEFFDICGIKVTTTGGEAPNA